jgi:homoserine dehydrogenase
LPSSLLPAPDAAASGASPAVDRHPPLRIGIAGLGTVGCGTLDLLRRHATALAERCGRPLEPVAVSARHRGKARPVEIGGLAWHDDPLALAADPSVDVVVELIGGADGIARRLVEASLEAGKPVVTANKAMLALHGTALARLAEQGGTTVAYEAAVAGGIPIIKTLREGLAANRIERIYGILNGTCNYILTTMRETGREFTDVLADAQRLGYAEADPSFDVDGIDAAHKLAILTSLAFGCEVDFAGVHIEGIRQVSAVDIAYADELGYRIKLLGMARPTAYGIEQRVGAAMVPLSAPIAHVEGVFNAVVTEGDFVGPIVMEGRGAGAGATASAVVADLMDIARSRTAVPMFGVPAAWLSRRGSVPIEKRTGAFYIRLMVLDRPGVIADVAAALRDEQVSLEAMLQRGRAPNETVPVVLTTHDAEEDAMRRALDRIAALDSVVEPPHMIRIEAL